MKEKNFKLIAVCISKVHEETQKETLISIYDRAFECGYKLIVINSFNDMFLNDRASIGESKIFSVINYKLIDGIILFGETIKNQTVLDEIIKSAKTFNIPLVSIDKKLDYGYNIKFSYENSMEQIVRHIVEFHKLTKINFIAGVKGNSFSEERVDVYKKILQENNVPIEEERIGYGDFWSIPTQRVVEDFLKSDLPFPEAIICANDTMAMCTCDVLNQHGYKVPDDVLVTGFDGINQEKYHIPRLTTAKQNNKKAGKCAIDILDSVFNGETPQKENIIYHDFVLGGSCKCAITPPLASNTLTNALYEKLDNYMFYERQMQEMISVLTDTNSISEMVSKSPVFTNSLYVNEIWICVCQDFLCSASGDAFGENVKNSYDMLRVLIHSYGETYSNIPNFHVTEMLPNLIENLSLELDQLILFSPLHFQEKTIGYIAMAIHPKYFDFNKHLVFSMTFSNILEIVQTHGELKQAIYKLEEIYIQDYLTGLMNRRGFYKQLKFKLEELKNDTNKKFMIISIDLNGLKYINDVFGHGEGDNAIKTVARCMISNAVKDEICARFGGDEFVVAGIIQDGSDYAQEYVKQFKSSIAYYNKHSNKPYDVGASCGIYIGTPNSELDVDAMIKIADDIMYEEKSKTKYKRGR